MRDADYVFEVSYEICNKIGGIYAVIKSKAARMVEQYGDKYCAVGYFEPGKARLEFDEGNPPADLEKAFKRLEKKGIKCHYGMWLIPGRPNTILLDVRGYGQDINKLKKYLWEDYKIDSLKSDSWFDDPLKWSHASGILLEEITKESAYKGRKVVGHFHEWMSGFGLLHIHKHKLPVATVFTTHATMLGRSISGSGTDLYGMVNKGIKDGVKASVDLARQYGCEDKHTTEVACAGNADAFTTVSEVTGREAQFILGKKPDILVFNGLDISRFPEAEELSVLRKRYRDQMREFLISYFCRYYYVDFYNIRSMFISGRYEFHNKGIDVYIDALGRLNKKLKKEKSKKNVVAFIFVPSGTRGEDIQVLKNKALFEEIHDQVDARLPDIGDRILELITKGEAPENVLSEDFLVQARKLTAHFIEKRGLTPPLCAFELSYPADQDSVIQAFRRNELLNREEDKVKVIFYPAYLSSADRFIALEYNQATLTCDVGVFPSFYEPWGYTPLETAAQGTLAVTTDLAGYGQFIKGKGDGIQVLDVDGVEYGRIVDELYMKLHEIVHMDKKELTRRRMNAKELAALADWRFLIENYVSAHDIALAKLKKRG
jgi:glycogen(starch) synthase